MNDYVITGGPSCGKTSVIRELSRRGYYTVPDNARLFIDQKISDGHDADDVRDEYYLSSETIELDIEAERMIPPHETAFLDYSLACNAAYEIVFGGEDVEWLMETCEGRYANPVFRFERLPLEDDEVRNETDEETDQVHEELYDVYNNMGYSIVDVPVMPIDERADFVENHVDDAATLK